MLEVQPIIELRPATIFARISAVNKEFLKEHCARLNMPEAILLNELLTILRVNNLVEAHSKEAPMAKKKKAVKKVASKKKPVSKKR